MTTLARGHLLLTLLCGVLCGGLALPFAAGADEIRPALLELNEREDGRVDVTWKVPMRGGSRLALTPVLPESLAPVAPPSGRAVEGAWVEHSSYRSEAGSLAGAVLSIDGLAGISTDVLVRVQLADGTTHSAVLRASNLAFTVPETPGRWELAVAYWQMGTVHILEGFDHLLFLVTLLLIVSGLWPLIKTVTAFTIAHSLTLVLTTLGLMNIPPAPTEAVISLSILLLAVEALNKGRGELTLAERFPWLIAFAFGLVHGLGFAGALAEIGVPRNEVPLALLMFNVGVETGQVLFVVVISLLLAGLSRVSASGAALLTRTVPYAIGGIAAFWTLERIDSFL